MCFNKPSKALNPQAKEFWPTPAAAPLPRIIFPSYFQWPSAALPPEQVLVTSAASPPYAVLPRFCLQQPYFYHSHSYIVSSSSYGCFNEAGKATGFDGRDDQTNIHHKEQVLGISVEENMEIARKSNLIDEGNRWAEGSFPVGKKPTAKLQRRWRPITKKYGGASYHPPPPPASDFPRQKTTVMIKNIPNQFGRDFMLRFLDEYCKDYTLEYDFLYLPKDFRSGNNLGYAFVNFTTASSALQFKKLLQNHKWEVVYTDSGPVNSRKICEVRWARIQGKEALIDRFKNSKFSCDRMDFLPVVLDPPRRGLNPDNSTMMVIGNCSGFIMKDIS